MIPKEFLEHIPIFATLPSEDHLSLVSLWKPRSLQQGDVLFRKGETGLSMYVIEKGTIEISVPLEQTTREMSISILHEGEFVGELSLLAGLPRSATATALEECSLVEMTRDDFLAFLMERPAVAIAMLNEIGKRLQSTNELVASLASKNLNEEIEEQMSVGDRLADKIAEFGGSWKFIIAFLTLLFGWMILNTIQLFFQPLDRFPFIFLNLMLSLVAAIQAPIIMMSQNRAQKKDRLRADLDYQVNLKSELMLQDLHVKFDQLRAEELHTMQENLLQYRALVEKNMKGLPKKKKRPAKK